MMQMRYADMPMIRSSSGDDDSTDDKFVDKNTARDLQSRFRTVGGRKGTIADEEIHVVVD